MLLDLLEHPIEYYSNILSHTKKCYLAEDIYQIIIGIDCEYIDSNEYTYKDLINMYFEKKQNSLSLFDGFFGVFGYDTIHYFEEIDRVKEEQYTFPTFIFAESKAYLHYDKKSKVYTFYGNKEKYIDLIISSNNKNNNKTNDYRYSIVTDVEEEKAHIYSIIDKAKEYIKNGDIFQVVLSSQLKIETNLDSLTFYKELSKQNPSPYMFHFPTKYGDVVGSSPEILAQISNDEIYIAPIAGTRPRGKDEYEDEELARDLLSDEKECAEHRMLIDLARNDVGKFSERGSIVVKNPMHIQYYQHVMHIVSEVYGKKKKDISIFDIISIVFPAGTLSGAPKIRAMEIISELEKYNRHIYGGGIGFLHYNGDMQIAIIIRTAFYDNKNDINNVYVQAGAGIVYDSVDEKEYLEIIHKRQSLINVFNELCKNDSEEAI